MAQNIKVNIVPKDFLPEFRVSEGDVGRTMIATILDSDGTAFTIPDDSTVTFVGTKPSGLGFTIACTYSTNVVTFVSEDTMDNEVGCFPCEIRITDTDENRIGTCNVNLNVEPDPHPDDTTDGDAEPLVNQITALLEEITEAHSTAMTEISEAKEDALDAIQEDVDAAAASAAAAAASAEEAAQTAATSGYMHFYIDDGGNLILTKTDNVVVDFFLQDGYLYVQEAA